MKIMHRRDDGTFVIERNGHPYHVIPDDPLFPVVEEAAKGMSLPPEPAPETPPAPPAPPEPTLAELQAQLAAIQERLAAMATPSA